MNECVKHSDAIWRGVNHTHALAHEIRRAAKHKKSSKEARARSRDALGFRRHAGGDHLPSHATALRGAVQHWSRHNGGRAGDASG